MPTLLESFKTVDFSAPLFERTIAGLMRLPATHELYTRVAEGLYPPHPILLAGGGSGTPTVARALRRINPNSQFSMLANTGEVQFDKNTKKPVGAGLIRTRVTGAPDWIDVAKQSIHASPPDQWGPWHHFLDAKPIPNMRVAYLVLEALRQISSSAQAATDAINVAMENPYRVIPTADRPCEARYLIGSLWCTLAETMGQVSSTSPILEVKVTPLARLSTTAQEALSQARIAIIGPGDVNFSVLFHFCVNGFAQALAAVPHVILITNLTARPIDIPGFTLSDLLALYRKHFAGAKQLTAVVHQGPIQADDQLEDDLREREIAHDFRLVRADLASSELSHNGQLTHDAAKLARALAPLLLY